MHKTHWHKKPYITTWEDFNRIVRNKSNRLLERLDDFPGSILVSGCQRSGTTMLSRIITGSKGMTKYWFSPDDELDAALILSGYVEHVSAGRYCFQTTYLDERYVEYFDHLSTFFLIWLIRNPYSVVNSMLNNWGDGATDQLFKACGIPALRGMDSLCYRLFGSKGLPLYRRACWAYIAKLNQLQELIQQMHPGRLLVVDYDDLVSDKDRGLASIYDFIGLPYLPEYSATIHSKSQLKNARLTSFQKSSIRRLCEPGYLQARREVIGSQKARDLLVKWT